MIIFETINRDEDKDHFMRILFKLDNPPPYSAYCGVYTQFSTPPYVMADFSYYNSIEFEIRYKTKISDNPLNLSLQIGVLGIPDYEYHEKSFEIPGGLINFAKVIIPFKQFKTPTWAKRRHEFDKSKIFRIALIIKGKETEGYIDVDNFKLSTSNEYKIILPKPEAIEKSPAI